MTFLLSSDNVFDYLVYHRICYEQEKLTAKIELKPAKNFNLLVTLADDRQLLVKQERYNQNGKTLGEFQDEWRIHNLCQKFPEVSYLRNFLSEVVHFDVENSILVFNYLHDYQDLAEFYGKDEIFPTKISGVIGANLAEIHRSTFNKQYYHQFLQNSTNDLKNAVPNLSQGLEKITPQIFGSLPADGIKFFALYQKYDTLGKAIAQLNQEFYACCLTHNDLKLNNLLLSHHWESNDEKMIRLIDWERGNWGDPANDLGSLIASYLQIWLYSLVASKTIPIEECLRLAAIPLHTIQPSISTLVNAYLTNFPEVLETRPNFLNLVIQFSGLALIRAIQARLQHQKIFGNSGICILQVAKSLLCRPQGSISTVFGRDFLETIANSHLFDYRSVA
ncbi:phosphotransferase [Anabaena sp. FACHB-1237]|uniref:phosphotransferase n=1 Tax=Anabaena sp. FACHB-1237 TaxID=2692769 RepID=UPI001680D9AE|nr:phosphotransferase [Anabaena sp. FACHB-1237]MBD2137217.1 phosphotransferase [Anabaena sp. FACHB-1237]